MDSQRHETNSDDGSDSDHDFLTTSHMKDGKRRHSESSDFDRVDSPMPGGDETSVDSTRNPRKKRAVKQPAVSLYVAKAEEAAARVSGSTADLGDATLLKIQKMLSRADQQGANESEAKTALRRANELMNKLNVSRAEVLAHNPDGQKEFAGQSTLTIQRRDGNPDLPVLLTSWASRLCHAMRLFFSIKVYTTKIHMKHQKKTAYIRLTFYGIAENTVTAASAYEMVFTLLGLWTLAYKGTSSRNSYCLGVCEALEDLAESERKQEEKAASVAEEAELARRTQQEQADRQAELDRLTRNDVEDSLVDNDTAFTMLGNGGSGSVGVSISSARIQTATAGPATSTVGVQASCEDATGDNEGGSGVFHGHFYHDDGDTNGGDDAFDEGNFDRSGHYEHRSDGGDSSDEEVEEEDEDDTEEQVARHLFSTLLSPEPSSSPKPDSPAPYAEALQPGNTMGAEVTPAQPLPEIAVPKVDEPEPEPRWKSRTALIAFHKTADKIADECLKANCGKMRRGRKYKMKQVDWTAFDKGREDAKKIDVRRKAIAD